MAVESQFPLFSEFPPVSTAEWEARIVSDLKGADYHKKLIWKTYDGIDVKPYYRSEDLQAISHIGIPPGMPPFSRGVRAQDQNWEIREDIEIADLRVMNDRIREMVSRGVNSAGIPADSVTTVEQMGLLLKEIDLQTVSVNFISSDSFPDTLDFFINYVSHSGLPASKIKGSFNFDPIGELLKYGDFQPSWEKNLEESLYMLRNAHDILPGFSRFNINAKSFQDSGATLVQELAFGLAVACEYLSAMDDKGLNVDQVAPLIRFSFAAGPHYFMEIAKLRAARILWCRMVEQFKPSNPESLKVFIHVSTANWNKSVYDPYVNMLRTTTEGMSAILGDADSLCIHPFKSAFGVRDEFSARIARNQQLILKEESYLDKIADPAAGSYYIEILTENIAIHAWELFKKIEYEGGILNCIKSDFIQDEISASRLTKKQDIAQRRMIMLGTNQYPNLREEMADEVPQPMDEISGESAYKKLVPFRAAEDFEKLRLATERFVKNGGKRPGVFLFTIGNLAMLRARAGFTTNFFGCAGYDITDNPGFSNITDGVEAAMQAKADIVVICSSDEEYPQFVPEIANCFRKSEFNPYLIVAGYPREYIGEFRKAGIQEFIHVRSDLFITLLQIQKHFGIMI